VTVPTATLGRSGLVVSRLCFGTLTVGPFQLALDIPAGGALIREALERGVNFFDTAAAYRTYPYLAWSLKGRPPSEAVICSKSYDWEAAGMRATLDDACRALDRDYIDIFMLHEQDSPQTLRGHRAALEELVRARERGRVRAVGVSTHSVTAAEAVAEDPEVDVLFAIINAGAVGIQQGDLDGMQAALERAHAAGKGTMAMKVLGGGHLAADPGAAVEFVRRLPYIDCLCIGIGSSDELSFALAAVAGEKVPPEVAGRLRHRRRRLLIEPWCSGCGRCVDACHQGALRLRGGRPVVDEARCVLCGYCGAACPGFHIKIVPDLREPDLRGEEARAGCRDGS